MKKGAHNRTLYFKDDFYDKLEKKAAKKELSVSSYIRLVMVEKWDKKEKKND